MRASKYANPRFPPTTWCFFRSRWPTSYYGRLPERHHRVRVILGDHVRRHQNKILICLRDAEPPRKKKQPKKTQ